MSLAFVAALEQTLVSEFALRGAADERVFNLAALLIMIWASLRWSDAQRVCVGNISYVQGVLRGRCWQVKTSKSGMPFACVGCGLLGLDWGSVAYQTVQA